MSPAPGRDTLAFIGAGRLGRALAPLLAEAGYRVTAVGASRMASARRACRGIRGARATTDLARAVRDARWVLLAVPDRSIAAVARRLAALSAVDWSGRTVLHHAGALGPEVLAPLADAGAATGVLHPLACLGRPELARAVLPGSRARIEGHPTARSAARALARALGLAPLPVRRVLSARDRHAYHTAAAVASNDIVALWAAAAEILGTIGLRPADARAALGALARGTLLHLERLGVRAALTGPAARGDRSTLAAHDACLRARSRDLAEAHRRLSRYLGRLARSNAGAGPPRGPTV